MSGVTTLRYDKLGRAVLELDFRRAKAGTVSGEHLVKLCTECGQPCIIRDSAKGRRFIHTANVNVKRDGKNKFLVRESCFIPAMPAS